MRKTGLKFRSIMGRLDGPYGLAASSTLAIWAAVTVTGPGNDFRAGDWVLARAMWAGLNPYQPISSLAETLDTWVAGAFTFTAPRTPAALILQLPLGVIPDGWVWEAGRLLIGASIVFFAWTLVRLTGRPVFWLTPLLAWVWPFDQVMFHGQSTFLVAGCLGLAWVWLLEGKDWQPGVPLAVAVALKLWPALPVAALFLAGRRRAAYTTGGVFTALTLAGILWPNIRLADAVAAVAGGAQFVPWAENIAPTAVLGAPAWTGVVAAGLFLTLVPRLGWESAYAWSIPVSLVAAPLVWTVYLPVLLVSAAAAARLPDKVSQSPFADEIVADGGPITGGEHRVVDQKFVQVAGEEIQA